MPKIVVERFPAKGGKTTKALEKVDMLLKENKEVAFISGELAGEELKARIDAICGDIKDKRLVLCYSGGVKNEHECLISLRNEGVDAVVIDTHKDISKELEGRTYNHDVYLFTQKRADC